jgi:hypothetical protein
MSDGDNEIMQLTPEQVAQARAAMRAALPLHGYTEVAFAVTLLGSALSHTENARCAGPEGGVEWLDKAQNEIRVVIRLLKGEYDPDLIEQCERLLRPAGEAW